MRDRERVYILTRDILRVQVWTYLSYMPADSIDNVDKMGTLALQESQRTQDFYN